MRTIILPIQPLAGDQTKVLRFANILSSQAAIVRDVRLVLDSGEVIGSDVFFGRVAIVNNDAIISPLEGDNVFNASIEASYSYARGASVVSVVGLEKKLNKGYYSNPDSCQFKISVFSAGTSSTVFFLIDYEVVQLDDLAYIYQNLPIEF